MNSLESKMGPITRAKSGKLPQPKNPIQETLQSPDGRAKKTSPESTPNIGPSYQTDTPKNVEERSRSRSSSTSSRKSSKNDVSRIRLLSMNRRLSLRSSSTPKTAPSTPQEEEKGRERSSRSRVPRPIKGPEQSPAEAGFVVKPKKGKPFIKITNEERSMADQILRSCLESDTADSAAEIVQIKQEPEEEIDWSEHDSGTATGKSSSSNRDTSMSPEPGSSPSAANKNLLDITFGSDSSSPINGASVIAYQAVENSGIEFEDDDKAAHEKRQAEAFSDPNLEEVAEAAAEDHDQSEDLFLNLEESNESAAKDDERREDEEQQAAADHQPLKLKEFAATKELLNNCQTEDSSDGEEEAAETSAFTAVKDLQAVRRAESDNFGTVTETIDDERKSSDDNALLRTLLRKRITQKKLDKIQDLTETENNEPENDSDVSPDEIPSKRFRIENPEAESHPTRSVKDLLLIVALGFGFAAVANLIHHFPTY